MPEFWIFAGPNGSGKSTLYNSMATSHFSKIETVYLNPDVLNLELKEQHPDMSDDDRNLRAAKLSDQRLDEAIEAQENIVVETVLSSPKFRARVERARELNYVVKMVYVTLGSADLNVDRVTQRVQLGGHSVPKQKIKERWRKSINQFTNFFAWNVHVALIFDNSDGKQFMAQIVNSFSSPKHTQVTAHYDETHILLGRLKDSVERLKLSHVTWIEA